MPVLRRECTHPKSRNQSDQSKLKRGRFEKGRCLSIALFRQGKMEDVWRKEDGLCERLACVEGAAS